LFHSVQLNVNNPHFLIMQGRITKVLNMKPVEILGMVEEAAGTRMYESKKTSALKTIEKKQAKVDELNTVLAEEITPTLEKLRGEKQVYLKWSKNNAEIERIERFCIAHEFWKNEKNSQTQQAEVEKMQTEVEKIEDDLTDLHDKLQGKEKDMESIQGKLSSEIEGKHKEAKAKEVKISKDLVKVNSSWSNAKKNIDAAKSDNESASKLVHDAQKAVEAKQAEIDQDGENCQNIRDAADAANKHLKDIQEKYENMVAGISTEEGEEGASLPEQIANAHVAANTADAKGKQAKMTLDHLTKSVKTVEKDMKKEESSAKALKSKREAMLKKVEDLNKQASKTGFSEELENQLYEKKKQLEMAYRNARETVDILSAQIEGRLSFNYSDPHKGFDRNKVKGLVAKLVTVANPRNATALEVAAGGKLYQVVVDKAETGKALLAKGKLQRRVTIVPLDKIESRTLQNKVVNTAKTIAKRMGTTSSPAIELVGFDEEVRTAVEFVFGSSLIVDGMDAASKICDETKTRTVTLEGDVFDPQGTISGGSNKNLGATLQKLTEYANAKIIMDNSKTELGKVEKEYNKLQQNSKAFGDINGKLQIARAELVQTETHMSQTKYGMLNEKYEEMQKELEQAKQDITDLKIEMDAKWKLHKDLKAREAELTKARENKLKSFDKEVAKAKKDAAAASKKARELDNNSETLRIELAALQQEVIAAKENVGSMDKMLEELQKESDTHEALVDEQKSLYQDAKDELEDIEAEMAELTKDLKELTTAKNKLNNEIESKELDIKKQKVEIDRYGKNKGQAERVVANMLKKHTWIGQERDQFGEADGDYDFVKKNPEVTTQKLKKLKKEQETMNKKINKKVMGMIEKAEGEYTELIRKRKVVENDKKKIESVIQELDEKKKTELQRTWTKVNRDFGSIFTTLLPGTSAKLEPPEGMQCWEGLEVKVAFGGVWKESLSELSGGQRSLLALSLILSMLLFKPAPMYILDEVDAALDLSHTQNIGNMLKTHFSQSQFIVVSLKEGMFNNANVIFRTKFVDGVSTVTKTIGIGASDKGRALKEKNTANNENKATGEKASKKAKTASGRGGRAKGIEN